MPPAFASSWAAGPEAGSSPGALLLAGGAALLLLLWALAAWWCQPRVVRPPAVHRRIVTVNHEQPVHDLTRPQHEDGRATVSELADLARPMQCACTQDFCRHPRGLAKRGHEETHLPRNQTQFTAADGWLCEDRHF